MKEELTIMILLNMGLDTATLATMEEELLSQVILNPEHSTFLLREALMATTLSTRTLKPRKI